MTTTNTAYRIVIEAYGWEPGPGFYDVIVAGRELARAVAMEAAKRLAADDGWVAGPPKIVVEDGGFTWATGDVDGDEQHQVRIIVMDAEVWEDLEGAVGSVLEAF